MRGQVKDFIKNCDVCQRHKSENLTPRGLLQSLTIPKKNMGRYIYGLHRWLAEFEREDNNFCGSGSAVQICPFHSN
jgi:hypothetical protein